MASDETSTRPAFSLSVPDSEDPSRSSSPAPDTPPDIELDSVALKERLLNVSDYPNDRWNAPPPEEELPGYVLTRNGGQQDSEKVKGLPGLKSTDVYETTLPWWRAAVRREIVKSVHWESDVIARMQHAIRTPWLDAYFVYTSSLGTHTFFMTFLPIMFFFGFAELGRGLIIVLALGVYCSSFIKDLICSPRPFAPPVTRLTIGSHHLEYGFPSTHSTNSVSIALFFFALVHHPHTSATASYNPIADAAASQESNSTSHLTTASAIPSNMEPVLSRDTFTTLVVILVIYTFSIVFGRLYTAMHSFTDCIVGVYLGATIWWAHTSFPGIDVVLSSGSTAALLAKSVGLGKIIEETGALSIKLCPGLGLGARIESWVVQGSYEVPLILIPLCLLAVNQHPQPVDDCPCFEDAIAFGSVVLGALLGRWSLGAWRESHIKSIVMPGSGWVWDSAEYTWMSAPRSFNDVALWWIVATAKVVVGILAIFTWRLVAKSVLHITLPPTIRFVSRISPFSLPNRRFYTPATEYTNVPSEFSGPASDFGLRAVPSVIDLPSSVGVGEEMGGIGSGSGSVEIHHVESYDARVRENAAGGAGSKPRPSPLGQFGDGNNERSVDDERGEYKASPKAEREVRDKHGKPVKHYDADVLTKVIVYAGIALIATEGMPLLFELLGWGIKSWP
ncbi:hypothetical protein HGRIS_000155 [Hohenbuehelia grisea]|uniref:Phosphatidic acid phosphatase type 2/haloperoxidase domain-containing protein n=1 Tax=Hohenbuehelia grisea TaxID=104357 RepID=A0ABR3JQ76_9AGAR